MPDFHHSFDPPAQDPVGNAAALDIREIEDAGVREILQTPGVALGSWNLLAALLDPGNPYFVFREPLGQAREVKTAVSGLFGRFVARAYATRYLQYSHYQNINRPPMRLGGPMRGQVRRVRGMRGDLPDWVVWSAARGLGIIEAKGCHDVGGPTAALTRAHNQARRAEIIVGGRLAPFKRYAIATRWGFAQHGPPVPMLAVRDPEVDGEGVTPEELSALGLGVVRRHYAALLAPLGHAELASALVELAAAPFRNRQARALASARQAFEHSSAVGVTIGDLPRPVDDLIGGFVTRNGPMSRVDLSIADQTTLARLEMRPTFVGLERRTLKLAIEGDLEELKVAFHVPRRRTSEDHGPEDDGSGAWVIRLDEDRIRLRGGDA